ncbi:hypothetical protein C1646_810858 [Rhizophagus diaphanus]|nr:hypothetical protein C1646_810858 [Rhizophagus diaphanus] [Rhizophagus sp. MUCL 43196]
MTRGNSLEQDLSNLAARSEVFDRLLYNGTKKKPNFFPKINSSEIILTTIKNADYLENYSPELLSKVVDIMPLSEDNIILNLLVETVSIIPLDTIEFGRLSIKALQYLLSCTHKKEKPCATPEYEVFRYGAIHIIEPLEIAPSKIIMDVYRQMAKSSNLVSDNGKVVYAPNGCEQHQCVRAKMPLDYKGIFEWSVIIEKHYVNTWIGDYNGGRSNYCPQFKRIILK